MNQKLIDLVINQIKSDIEAGDVTAIEELLKNVDEAVLKSFLSEVK